MTSRIYWAQYSKWRAVPRRRKVFITSDSTDSQAEIADKTSDSMGETHGVPVRLKQGVENLFSEVARRHLWSIRLFDGWNALRK